MDSNKHTDEFGYVEGDTINLKSVFGRLRRKTGEIAEASKKIAGDVSEVIKNSVKESEPAEVETDPESKDHIVISAVEQKEEKDNLKENDEVPEEENVQDVLPPRDDDILKLAENIRAMTSELETVKLRLQAIQLSSEDGVCENTKNISSLKKSVGELKERITELIQTTGGISRVSDSVFDLKNAQINMKKSIDSAETAIKQLKRKLNTAVAVLSVLSVLIIALQIIALLS